MTPSALFGLQKTYFLISEGSKSLINTFFSELNKHVFLWTQLYKIFYYFKLRGHFKENRIWELEACPYLTVTYSIILRWFEFLMSLSCPPVGYQVPLLVFYFKKGGRGCAWKEIKCSISERRNYWRGEGGEGRIYYILYLYFENECNRSKPYQKQACEGWWEEQYNCLTSILGFGGNIVKHRPPWQHPTSNKWTTVFWFRDGRASDVNGGSLGPPRLHDARSARSRQDYVGRGGVRGRTDRRLNLLLGQPNRHLDILLGQLNDA